MTAGRRSRSGSTTPATRPGRPGGSTRYLYAQQANFNVVALTASDGTVIERVKYDPYGEATVTVEQGQSASGNPYLFTGRQWDPESDLYYFRNRYYSPRLGGWAARGGSDKGVSGGGAGGRSNAKCRMQNAAPRPCSGRPERGRRAE